MKVKQKCSRCEGTGKIAIAESYDPCGTCKGTGFVDFGETDDSEIIIKLNLIMAEVAEIHKKIKDKG